MSDTPKTDAQEYHIDGHYHVSVTLARELERENIALRGALVSACGTIREARLFVEGKSPIRAAEAAALLAGAEADYRKAAKVFIP